MKAETALVLLPRVVVVSPRTIGQPMPGLFQGKKTVRQEVQEGNVESSPDPYPNLAGTGQES